MSEVSRKYLPAWQLSEKFVNEGIVFNNLEASAQDALKEDVLRQLRHARQTTPVNFPEWEELKVTMRAYGGITSVTVVMGAGLRHKRKADEDEEDVMVRRKWRRKIDTRGNRTHNS